MKEDVLFNGVHRRHLRVVDSNERESLAPREKKAYQIMGKLRGRVEKGVIDVLMRQCSGIKKKELMAYVGQGMGNSRYVWEKMLKFGYIEYLFPFAGKGVTLPQETTEEDYENRKLFLARYMLEHTLDLYLTFWDRVDPSHEQSVLRNRFEEITFFIAKGDLLYTYHQTDAESMLRQMVDDCLKGVSVACLEYGQSIPPSIRRQLPENWPESIEKESTGEEEESTGEEGARDIVANTISEIEKQYQLILANDPLPQGEVVDGRMRFIRRIADRMVKTSQYQREVNEREREDFLREYLLPAMTAPWGARVFIEDIFRVSAMPRSRGGALNRKGIENAGSDNVQPFTQEF